MNFFQSAWWKAIVILGFPCMIVVSFALLVHQSNTATLSTTKVVADLALPIFCWFVFVITVRRIFATTEEKELQTVQLKSLIGVIGFWIAFGGGAYALSKDSQTILFVSAVVGLCLACWSLNATIHFARSKNIVILWKYVFIIAGVVLATTLTSGIIARLGNTPRSLMVIVPIVAFSLVFAVIRKKFIQQTDHLESAVYYSLVWNFLGFLITSFISFIFLVVFILGFFQPTP